MIPCYLGRFFKTYLKTALLRKQELDLKTFLITSSTNDFTEQFDLFYTELKTNIFSHQFTIWDFIRVVNAAKRYIEDMPESEFKTYIKKFQDIPEQTNYKINPTLENCKHVLVNNTLPRLEVIARSEKIYNPTKVVKNFDELAQQLVDDVDDEYTWVLQKYTGKPLADKICKIYEDVPIIKSLSSHELIKLKLSLIKASEPANRIRRIANRIRRIVSIPHRNILGVGWLNPDGEFIDNEDNETHVNTAYNLIGKYYPHWEESTDIASIISPKSLQRKIAAYEYLLKKGWARIHFNTIEIQNFNSKIRDALIEFLSKFNPNEKIHPEIHGKFFENMSIGKLLEELN